MFTAAGLCLTVLSYPLTAPLSSTKSLVSPVSTPFSRDSGSNTRGLDLLHTHQLVLHGTAIIAMVFNSGKSSGGGLNLLHVLPLVFHGAAVPTRARNAPCDNRSISQNDGESRTGGLDLLHGFNRSCTELLSPPEAARPHVTTDPSLRMAAKAA